MGEPKAEIAQGAIQPPETARDRVRRLVIAPLMRDGMRFARGTDEDQQRKRLDRMADDLTYMSDAALGNLKHCLRTKGEGSKGQFWPARVTVLKYANMAQARPIEDIPGFRSWFVSQAGADARVVPGRLVAEYQFWCRHFHPPTHPDHKRVVATRADDMARRADYLASRKREGARLSEEDSGWLHRFNARDAMLRRWIDGQGSDAEQGE